MGLNPQVFQQLLLMVAVALAAAGLAAFWPPALLLLGVLVGVGAFCLDTETVVKR